MAVRIYSLAKVLGIDSEEVVHACINLGMAKGSVLASLETDEVIRLKEYFDRKRNGNIEDHIAECPRYFSWKHRGLTSLPELLTDSQSIVELDLTGNRIRLSDESAVRLSQMPSLRVLRLAGNSIKNLPKSFCELTKVQELDLSDNLISDVPSAIGKLTELRVLALTSNNFYTFPASLLNLNHLVDLDISNNKLASIPNRILALRDLARFVLSNNKIVDLPEEICELNKLRELILDGNSLARLPENMHQLQSLEILSAEKNVIRTLPYRLPQCRLLWSINLYDNELEYLPDNIGTLSTLRVLGLSQNKIARLPVSIGYLPELETLDLSSNRLECLPESFRRFIGPSSPLECIFLHENPSLRIPPEILGPKANDFEENSAVDVILNFYFGLRSGRSRRLLEAKVLLVGQGGVGKTSIAKSLLDAETTLDHSQSQTTGISILKWSVVAADVIAKRSKNSREPSSVRVNLWDFGGQEIMHSTHQFFLTERSLYLLVLDARSGEHEGNLHGWLKTIQGFGGASPVLVVVNKCEPPHHLLLDETRLKLDYAPNLVGVFYVSCESKQGVDELRAAVERQILELPHVNDELPESYFFVKRELEMRAEAEDFVTQDQYRFVCQKHGIHDEESQRSLLQFLHDLGCVLHYDDPRQQYLVYDTNVLNPEWVTNGVYKILMNHELRANGDGKVGIADFDKLLIDHLRYPRERHRFLIDLMRKFDLCFALAEDSGQLLVPELLSPNEPDIGWDIGEFLNFQFHYSVLPRGLMPRFIVRTHHLLTKHRTYWRSGVVLEIEGCRIAVRGDTHSPIVRIQVQGGNPANRRRALAIVRDHFAAIHSSFPRLRVQAKIPLPGEPNAPAVDFEHLCRLEKIGQDMQLFEGAERQWSIRELLDGVIEREFDVFICYNSNDKQQAKTLSSLLRERGIRAWLDVVNLTPGKPWKAEIAEAISSCRSVAVLFGASGSGVWQLEEVRLALSEAAYLGKHVIPIILPGWNRIKIELPQEFRYLMQRTWVEFEDEFDEENVGKLCKGIRG